MSVRWLGDERDREEIGWEASERSGGVVTCEGGLSGVQLFLEEGERFVLRGEEGAEGGEGIIQRIRWGLKERRNRGIWVAVEEVKSGSVTGDERGEEGADEAEEEGHCNREVALFGEEVMNEDFEGVAEELRSECEHAEGRLL